MLEETKKTKEPEKLQSTKKKGLPTIIKVGLGCIIVLVVLGVVLSILGGFILKKLGSTFLSKSIEQKTGIQSNLSDIEKGKVSFTDPKTGAKLDVGSGTIPEGFPKDFPVYPGAKILSSLTGNQSGQGNGFWLTLSTSDSVDQVKSYYETNLKANGWTFEPTIGASSGVSWTVTKDKLNGYLTIDKSSGTNQTAILIVLGEGSTVTPPSPSQ